MYVYSLAFFSGNHFSTPSVYISISIAKDVRHTFLSLFLYMYVYILTSSIGFNHLLI